ncbi:MAG: hypothetical protein ACTSRZ_12950 [Promethearchaeota archaeon]
MNCPECTGELKYLPQSKKYVCKACGIVWTKSELDEYMEERFFEEEDSEEEKQKYYDEYKKWYFSKKK